MNGTLFTIINCSRWQQRKRTRLTEEINWRDYTIQLRLSWSNRGIRCARAREREWKDSSSSTTSMIANFSFGARAWYCPHKLMLLVTLTVRRKCGERLNDASLVSILDRASFYPCLFCFFFFRRQTFPSHHHDRSISYNVASCKQCTSRARRVLHRQEWDTCPVRTGSEREGAKMALFSSRGSEQHVRLCDRRRTELVDKGRKVNTAQTPHLCLQLNVLEEVAF